uniref:hypothetical protein n=1 Tax=Roseivirga sp. TaxID=1964215 RepID=UPI00404888FA
RDYRWCPGNILPQYSLLYGIGAGSICLGYVAEYYGIDTMFFICGLILLFPLAFYFLFVRNHYYRHLELLKKQ